MSKSRNLLLHIDSEELERIVKNSLGGVTIEIIVTPANIKVSAKTGEDEDVKVYQIN